MMLNFSVTNFSSIKDKITLSFEANKSEKLEKYYVVRPDGKTRVLKLAIIYGPNASGKTNILRALNFLKSCVVSPFPDKTKNFDFQPFLFDENSKEKNTIFEIEFFANKIKYSYFLELNKNAIISEKLYYYYPKKALIFERNTDTKKQIANIKFGSKIKISKEKLDALKANTLWNNTVLGGYLKTNIEQKELKDVVSWFRDKLMWTVFPNNLWNERLIAQSIKDQLKIKAFIINLLKKADLNIKDISFKNKKVKADISSLLNTIFGVKTDNSENGIGNGAPPHEYEVVEEVHLHHLIGEKEYSLPFEYESAGTKRYFELGYFLSFLIFLNTTLPVDELESSLHPDLIKHFLLTFLVNSQESQLIITTHHRELLMEKDIFRNDVIWFTEKKEDSSTDLFSLADFDTSVIRNTSSIYNAYKVGKLGAVPNLSDYFINF